MGIIAVLGFLQSSPPRANLFPLGQEEGPQTSPLWESSVASVSKGAGGHGLLLEQVLEFLEERVVEPGRNPGALFVSKTTLRSHCSIRKTH